MKVYSAEGKVIAAGMLKRKALELLILERGYFESYREDDGTYLLFDDVGSERGMNKKFANIMGNVAHLSRFEYENWRAEGEEL